MSLANNIKKIREDKKISIDDISKKTGLFKLTYLSIERGFKSPSAGLLKKIAAVFKMSVSEIIDYDSERADMEKKSLDIKNLKDISDVVKNPSISTLEPISISNVSFIPISPSTIRDTISRKPILLDRKDIFSFKNNINLVGVRDLSPNSFINNVDPLSGLISNQEKTSSPRLINSIEPFKWRGKFKTMFLTEVNTGFKVGDRVFILNGNYDSDILIKRNRYKVKRDGYKVLHIDNCKVVLDIDYTGVNPFNDESIDSFINVYYIRNQTNFKYFNRQLSTKNGVVDYKFNIYQNNIVYSDSAYSPTSGWGNNGGISGQGFFVKNNELSWIDVTNPFTTGNLQSILSVTVSNNNRIKINNGTFTYSIGNDVIEFKEGYVYKWDIEPPSDITPNPSFKWLVDITYLQPIISKSNFRDGLFTGEWNAGVYGRTDKKISWTGGTARWNLGTLINTRWQSGIMDSIYTLPVSFSVESENNIDYQKSNAPNNNGRGFNYIFDSELDNIVVKNGNFYNCLINGGITQSIVEDHILSTSSNFLSKIEGGLFINSEFIGTEVSDSNISNSLSKNSKFTNITSVNSIYKKSLLKDSTYLNDLNIKVLDYEELFFTISPSSRATHKVFRFYIDEISSKKIKQGDTFYIKGLIIDDGNNYPLNFFDRKFILSSWTEYIEVFQNNAFSKVGFEISAFLSTPGDNKWLYSVWEQSTNNYINTQVVEDERELFSIDIVISIRNTNSLTVVQEGNILKSEAPNSTLQTNIFTLNNGFSFTSSPQPPQLSNKIRNIVDISNAFIVRSDFESGIVETTDWFSGDNINYNNDVNISADFLIGGTYSMSINQNNQLVVQTTAQTNNLESDEGSFLKDDVVFLNVEFEPFVGSTIKLLDSYKIVNTDFRQTGQLILEELGTNSVISGITQSGLFKITGAENRYGYIYKTKIDKTKIKSGIFRRSYITNSFIENDNNNPKDKDFSNISIVKSLLLSDMIFKNTGNILSKATYLSSSFVIGSDFFTNGIVFKSIWNGITFSNGLIRESNWIGGVFEKGVFYNSRSFNASPNVNYQYYDVDRTNSYYKSGITTATISNNRYSWKNGVFNGGEFYKSDWENGQLNSGKFYFSKFYNGVISGGVLGDKKISAESTQIYNGTINNTTVDNAFVYASDTSFSGLSNSNINWIDGVFNGGLFGTNNTQTASNTATWNNGVFNGGEFISMAKWKNGIFNNGKFISALGWTLSNSLSQSDYTWENGVFNDGVFGLVSLGTNSTWYTGEFNGGEFTGRVWNDGIFSYGLFEGSATVSSTGGVSSSNASNFISGFTQSYYGLWRNGVVSDKRSNFIKDKKFFTTPKRFNYREPDRKVSMSNVLWISGTFSHEKGDMVNSVWLNGRFEKGQFINSSFNPYVNRLGSTQSTFELSDSCYWKNGNLINSDFYISKWEYGNFKLGNAYGMIWKNGICEYMNAFNIFWENGIWKNGNWYGSYLSYNGKVDDDFSKQILYRGISWSGTQSHHIWNIFDDASLSSNNISSAPASQPQNVLSIAPPLSAPPTPPTA
jgi:transcriptional regulator with XRE-family HTH domain